MSDHPQRELAPLAALGTLDGESLLDWREHAQGCAECRAELAAFESLAGSMGLAAGARRVPPRLRQRVMAAAVGVAAPARPARAPWVLAAAASLAAVGLGAAYLSARAQKGVLERRLARESAVTSLIKAPGTRTVVLAGLPAAPGAQARVVWNVEKRQAVLMATGLEPPPPDKAYELWVIAGGAPVPAGVFRSGADWEALHQMPWVEDAAQVKTFAVTLEPAAGVTAPTGPMVLAGAVS
jgi:hypothetical protein